MTNCNDPVSGVRSVSGIYGFKHEILLPTLHIVASCGSGSLQIIIPYFRWYLEEIWADQPQNDPRITVTADHGNEEFCLMAALRLPHYGNPVGRHLQFEYNGIADSLVAEYEFEHAIPS